MKSRSPGRCRSLGATGPSGEAQAVTAHWGSGRISRRISDNGEPRKRRCRQNSDNVAMAETRLQGSTPTLGGSFSSGNFASAATSAAPVAVRFRFLVKYLCGVPSW